MSRKSPSQFPLAALVVVLVVGSVGFFTGVSRDADPQGYVSGEGDRAPREASSYLREAPTHAELASGFHGPNRERYADVFDRLGQNRRGLTDEVGRPGDEEWNLVVSRRAERRAYDGAPPVVPHAITQRGFPPCLTCHRDGVVVGRHTAPAMSHEPMASCIQCHVVHDSPVPDVSLAGGPPEESSFRGVGRAGRGSRAWPGAPPTVPHTTQLRQRCDSCHGTLATGLRTSHACQQSCQQCHARAAGIDQQPLTSPPALPLAPVP